MKEWEIKMRKIIKGVLGNEYNVFVISDSEFVTLFNDKEILRTTSLKTISNHWREHSKNTIIHLVEKKIQINLSKV